ncbi:MAG: UDP-N-acetylmuramoyl-L-alanine--D-glutamate ligase [Streptococcaceae bacterium]|jgi:UDP-N-acetylmuramoylalanine--D-glutamate ligase|nr:UDP-N-acetylmuramoyl-L-alanine--D-glutamate ligase [Streptococcaceae bacterium]
MKNIKNYENKKVLVLGLARSGVSAAKLLNKLGALVTVNDAQPIDDNKAALALIDEGVRVIGGGHPLELLDEAFELIVKNPGIPYTNPMLVKAMEKNIPIVVEVELAYEISEAPIVGITGTNGKTTVTTMVGELLNVNRPQGKAILSGNIGYPASSLAQEVTKEDTLVMELSSFQLMGLKTFRPKIAAIINTFEAHLDFHGTRKEYVKAKWNIQNNMSADDILILNDKQEEAHELAEFTKAKVVFFSTTRKTEGAYTIDGKIFYQEEEIMNADELSLPGEHNLENALVAITIAKLSGVKNEDIRTTLMHFHGVAHRTQFVGELNNRRFFNDSKATNILATQMALSGFDNAQTILMAGGLDRGNSFDELVNDLKGLKAMVVFGETAQKMKEAGIQAGVSTIKEALDVKTGVKIAFELSKEGDTILLSPANASWDQYENFEARGDAFVVGFKKLKEGN